MSQRPSSRYGQVEWFEQKFRVEGASDVDSYYGHAVSGYQRFRYAYLLDLLKQSLPSEKPLSVLDVGCGVGEFLAQLKTAIPASQLTGVDFVKPVVAEAAARYPNMTFHQDSLPNLEKIRETFDLIIASEVLYYLADNERTLAIQRLCQLLKPRGYLFISSTIAPHAFTVDSLTELASPNFWVRQTWLQKSRYYLQLANVLHLPNKLQKADDSGNWPARYTRVFRLLRTPLIGKLLLAINRLLIYVSRPILRSVALPRLMSRLADKTGSSYANSNIIMLWQKEAKPNGTESLR
jgi:SAM-dependent methyltransferase